MLTSLEERFAKETDFLVLGTLLDPRFKDKSFSSAVFCTLKSQYTSELEDCQIEKPPSK